MFNRTRDKIMDILVDGLHASAQLQYYTLFEQKHDPLLTILFSFSPWWRVTGTT